MLERRLISQVSKNESVKRNCVHIRQISIGLARSTGGISIRYTSLWTENVDSNGIFEATVNNEMMRVE